MSAQPRIGGPLASSWGMGHLEHWIETQRAKLSELENTIGMRSKRILRHPKLSAHSSGDPPTQYFLPLWAGYSWGACPCPLCPQFCSSLQGHHYLDPGTYLASRALVWPSILTLPPSLLPHCLQWDPPLGSLLLPSCEDPPRVGHQLSPAPLCQSILPRLCPPQLNSFNMLDRKSVV